MVKTLPTIWETWVWSLDGEDPLEKEMATLSNILTWRVLQIEEPGELHGEGIGNPFQLFLPGKSHGQRSLVGYSPWGRKELDTIGQLTLSLS